MSDDILDLRDNSVKDAEEKLASPKSEHRREFEARLKRLDEKGGEAAGEGGGEGADNIMPEPKIDLHSQDHLASASGNDEPSDETLDLRTDQTSANAVGEVVAANKKGKNEKEDENRNKDISGPKIDLHKLDHLSSASGDDEPMDEAVDLRSPNERVEVLKTMISELEGELEKMEGAVIKSPVREPEKEKTPEPVIKLEADIADQENNIPAVALGAAANMAQEPEAAPLAPPPPPRPTRKLKFPNGFLWGTATSAYQIEGGVSNNWSMWERSIGRKLELAKTKKNVHDFICGQACDSYNRYEEDFKLAKGMNNNAVRVGIEWARVQPKKDTWNVDEINHYRGVLKAAKKRGLTTFVTLWHWTIPNWLAHIGGWENPEVVNYFLAFVDVVVKEFGVEIDYWVVLNEPMMFVYGGYLKAYHPPQKRSLRKAEKVTRHLALAYLKSYNLIHKHFIDAQVGMTNLLNYFEPAHIWNPIERLFAGTLHYFWNKRILEKTANKCDFVGVNYYFHDRMVWYPPFRKNKNAWTNDKGWEIYPKGIYQVLKFAAKYGKPIYILENGTADAADKHRERYIKEHLRYVHQAIADGADVRGYFHWSLLDNFEWSFGYEPKFGLYTVDRETFTRTPRPSAEVYKKICKENAVEVDEVQS